VTVAAGREALMIRDLQTAWKCAYDLKSEVGFIAGWKGNFDVAVRNGL
jgi:hypothetical protein